MDINLNVNFKCEGLVDLLRELAGQDKKRSAGSPEVNVAPAAAPKAEEEKVEPKKEPKKKAKEKEAEPDEAEEKADFETCRTLIRKYASLDGAEGKKGGLEKAHKTVLSFGVNKLTELPEEKFADFIKEVRKKLDEEEKPSADIF